MRILKIISAFLKLNVNIAFAYRANLAVELLTSVMWLAWELISLNVIYSNTDTLGGWSNGDMIVLLGVWKLVMGILFGAFGVHKFIIGLTTPAIIMLLVSLVGGIVTCGMAYGVMHVIGLVEGIIYLSKSDEEFYQTYIIEQKGWF